MKRILKIPVAALFILLSYAPRNNASAQYYDNNREVSYQTFYDELSPYGQWIDYPGQGYVWVPDAGPDFRPYSTNGHWVWSENYEWIWVSDYDWGWAPFHYGRWDNDPYYGWYWVPGYEWSPAWVAWRDGGDYYGWAPIRPGITISINFNIGNYNPPNDYWCFAPRRFITSPRIYDYCVDWRQNITIINYTTIIINYNYGDRYGFRTGPGRYDAERYCGRIDPARFRDSYTPGRTFFRNNEVSMYHPNVRHEDNRNFSPGKFERYDRNGNGGFRRNDNNRISNNNDRRDDNTKFERRNDNPGIERRDNWERQPPVNNGNNNNFPDRRFERRDNNNGNTNSPPILPENRRNDNNWQQRQPQQMERRQEQIPQQTQQQPRQFERRDDGDRQQNNSSYDNGRGNNRRRF